MNKTTCLQKIAQEIIVCTNCQKNSVGQAVPGEGASDAKVVFVGEAPVIRLRLLDLRSLKVLSKVILKFSS